MTFSNFKQISEYQPNFRILTFWNFSQYSEIQPNSRIQPILRMFKKNKMIVPLKDIFFDATKRQALITLYDQQSVDRTLMIVHGLGCGMSASMM